MLRQPYGKLGTTPQFGQVFNNDPFLRVSFCETTIFDKSYRYDLSADPMSQFIITLAEKTLQKHLLKPKRTERRWLRPQSKFFITLEKLY